MNDIEVDQKTDAGASQPEIGIDLRLMKAVNTLDGFELDYDIVLHNCVDAVSHVNSDAVIRDRQADLGFHLEAVFP